MMCCVKQSLGFSVICRLYGVSCRTKLFRNIIGSSNIFHSDNGKLSES